MHERLSPRATWNHRDSEELYRVKNWGDGHFAVAENGDATVKLPTARTTDTRELSLPDIISRLNSRGIKLPVVLRFPALLHSQISQLHDSFQAAIRECGYQNEYRGLYPIKVNQRAEVLKEMSQFGRDLHYGLEVGSKTELLAALAHMHDPDAFIVCNGYKDESYVALALRAAKMGLQVVLVLEMPRELDTILAQAKELRTSPLLGVRFKLTHGSGRWSSSNGENGLFGLNATQIVEVVDRLRECGKLDWLQMLHYHQGSQISSLQSISAGAEEAARVYAWLAGEGVGVRYLNTGGGLAIDYDGSRTASNSSKNYDLPDYCRAIVNTIRSVMDDVGIAHPMLLTECGRGVAAHYSVLVFNIADAARFNVSGLPTHLPVDADPVLREMHELACNLTIPCLREQHEKLSGMRASIVNRFPSGRVSLRECALADRILHYVTLQASLAENSESFVKDGALAPVGVDLLYANFSVFQSLPDHWALGQFFPVMPIHRLNSKPARHGIITDLTCDSDGKIKTYVHPSDESNTLPVHHFEPGENYMIGAFLTGAYQETLGDMHNLFGTTHVVSVEVDDEQGFTLGRIVRGDSSRNALTFLEYDIERILESVSAFARNSVNEGKISPEESQQFVDEYETNLGSYTYLNSG